MLRAISDLNRQKDEPVSSIALKRTLGLACFLLKRTNNIGYHSSASPLNAAYGGLTGSRWYCLITDVQKTRGAQSSGDQIRRGSSTPSSFAFASASFGVRPVATTLPLSSASANH